MKSTLTLLDEKIAQLGSREAYGGTKEKPSIEGFAVDYDVDVERGFTCVILEVKTRSPKSGRMSKKSRLVYGYAKRNNAAHDVQNEQIGLNKALRDAVRRALGFGRNDLKWEEAGLCS